MQSLHHRTRFKLCPHFGQQQAVQLALGLGDQAFRAAARLGLLDASLGSGQAGKVEEITLVMEQHWNGARQLEGGIAPAKPPIKQNTHQANGSWEPPTLRAWYWKGRQSSKCHINKLKTAGSSAP